MTFKMEDGTFPEKKQSGARLVQRISWRAMILWAGVFASGLGAAVASGHFGHDVGCLLTIPAINPKPSRVRFLSCTNIPQSFEVRGAKSLQAEAPGWQVLAPVGETARVVVTLTKVVDWVVFYPRLNNSGSVTVYETVGDMRKMLLRLSKSSDGWTSMGEQYPLCLGCIENGWSKEEFPVTLEIELRGHGAQLWCKDDLIFFEAPSTTSPT